MSLNFEYTKSRIGYLAMFGGFLMLVDTVWGGVASAGLDWSRASDVALGVVLIIGLPMYFLDVMGDRRIVVYLPALLVCRWIVDSYLGPPPMMHRLWHGTELLIVACALIQISKLRRNRKDLLPTGARAS